MQKPTLDFAPMFYILDRSCKWVIAVREYDWHPGRDYFYAFKGVAIAWQGEVHNWQVWPVYLNKQELAEYPTNYDLTKNYEEAIEWAYDNSRFPPIKEKVRAADFPAY